jgi:hypothetical protein
MTWSSILCFFFSFPSSQSVFSLLWQNIWQKQFKGGRIYLGSQFQRFQPIVEGRTWKIREVTSWWPGKRERMLMLVSSLLFRLALSYMTVLPHPRLVLLPLVIPRETSVQTHPEVCFTNLLGASQSDQVDIED